MELLKVIGRVDRRLRNLKSERSGRGRNSGQSEGFYNSVSIEAFCMMTSPHCYQCPQEVEVQSLIKTAITTRKK